MGEKLLEIKNSMTKNKLELNPGEVVCDKCEGEGYNEVKDTDFSFICMKCKFVFYNTLYI